jgi:hypothetical protein
MHSPRRLGRPRAELRVTFGVVIVPLREGNLRFEISDFMGSQISGFGVRIFAGSVPERRILRVSCGVVWATHGGKDTRFARRATRGSDGWMALNPG